jgi:hypothetical protein
MKALGGCTHGADEPIEAEYLMTVYVPLETPTADWLRVLPNGVQALDVRLSILADDGSYIFTQYLERVAGRERIRTGSKPPGEASYFLINPVFETSSEKYRGLNEGVCVGKDITPRDAQKECAMYEIFVLR